jgi:serine/threonine protein kinase
VIHRDLKPHNVILDEDGSARHRFRHRRAGASDMTLTACHGHGQYLTRAGAGFRGQRASDIARSA